MRPCARERGCRRRNRRVPTGDAGFTLLENVLAVVLVGLVLASAAVTFVGAATSQAALQRHQTAVRIAAEALAAAKLVPATPRPDGCVPLLDGRTAPAVAAQLAAIPAAIDLSSGDTVSTPDTCAGHAAALPLRGVRTGPSRTVADPVVVGGQAYSVQTVVSRCMIPRSGGICVPAQAVGNAAATFVYRVVVTVSWSSARGCPGGCVYSLETLRDPSPDPVFETRRPTPSAPVNLTAAPGDGTAELTWGTPASSGDSPILGYTVVATPDGGGAAVTTTVSATTARLTGLVNGVTYTISVTAFNAIGPGLPATTTVIPYPANVMTSARLAWWLDGADTATLTQDAAGGRPVTSTGQNVLRWRDKSPQHNDATVRPGQQPPSVIVGSDRLVPSWDGDTTCLQASPALLPNGATPSTTFVVATAADPVPAQAPYRVVVSWGTHAPGDGRQVYKVVGSARVGADTAWWDIADAPLDWSRTGAQLAAAQHDPSQVILWASGRPAVTTVTGTARSTGTDAAGLGCVIWPNTPAPDQFWRGPIQEVVVLSGTATDAERRAVEEYLARKWATPLTPQAPQNVLVARPVAGSMAVVWSAPAWDGGSPATSYTATASPGGAMCTSSGTGCVLSGLTPGTSYAVTVTADNVTGTGPASAPRTGTA